MENKNHPEWEKENSLTTPDDRDKTKLWRPDQGAPDLAEEQVTAAIQELNNTNFTNKFPKVDRTYADPVIHGQHIGLLSFVPAKGATPNENGVFGFGKLRGNFSTEIEANQHAEHLIRKVDSYHQIYHAFVGRPFPITFSSKYSAETAEVDIRRETTETISSNIKDKKEDEQKTVEDIKNREEILLKESKKAKEDDGTCEIDVDPYDEYITSQVKKAQLTWTFLEHIKKLHEIRGIIIQTREKLTQMDTEYPDFRGKYFDKYKKARVDAGFNMEKDETSDNFMKFMIEDVEIPTIDTDELLPKIAN